MKTHRWRDIRGGQRNASEGPQDKWPPAERADDPTPLIDYSDPRNASAREMARHRCRHFGDVPFLRPGAKCDAADIEFRKLTGGGTGWITRLPCNREESEHTAHCPHKALRSEEELAAEEAAHEHHLRCMLRSLSSCCEAPLDTSQVITKGEYEGHGPRFCSRCGRKAFVI